MDGTRTLNEHNGERFHAKDSEEANSSSGILSGPVATDPDEVKGSPAHRGRSPTGVDKRVSICRSPQRPSDSNSRPSQSNNGGTDVATEMAGSIETGPQSSFHDDKFGTAPLPPGRIAGLRERIRRFAPSWFR